MFIVQYSVRQSNKNAQFLIITVSQKKVLVVAFVNFLGKFKKSIISLLELGVPIVEKSTYSALTGEKVKTNKKEA
jgi:hypothetical protein